MNEYKYWRDVNGYKTISMPNHPRVISPGYIYEHDYIMEKEMGRCLRDDEEVHHLDEDISNNDIDNLIVIYYKHHQKLHGFINRKNKGIIKEKKYCITCNKLLTTTTKYCSYECSDIGRRKYNHPTKEQLLEYLKSNLSIIKIGEKYGVTEALIRKWCYNYNLPYKKADRNKIAV
jgi:hypothetical protein